MKGEWREERSGARIPPPDIYDKTKKLTFIDKQNLKINSFSG